MTRRFSSGAGLSGVDLEVEAGQVHALVGLNGAGKTTLLRLLLGMLRPDEGSVRIDLEELRFIPAAAWSKVGHLVGPPLAYPELSVRANLSIAGRLHGIHRADLPAVVDSAIDALDLGRYADVKARVLSEGNLQRLGLAAALQHGPELIILDEPTSNLDPAGVILLRDLLRRRVESGAAVLVSSHHLDEVARMADRITVINHGRIIGNLDPGGSDIERAFFYLVYKADMMGAP